MQTLLEAFPKLNVEMSADLKALQDLLVPAPSGLIRMHPVSTEVNNVRNNGPHLVDEAEPVTGR